MGEKVGWKSAKIGDFLDFVGGGTPNKKNSDYWGGNIKWASVKDIKSKYLHKTQDMISDIGLKNSSSQLAIEDELILVTRISPGKCVIAKDKIAINQDLKIVRPKLPLSINFLYYLFTSKENEFINKSSGTTVKGIRLEEIRSIEANLPPLPEQRAIVSKIEQLFSELDNGIANLKLAQEQLKVYRQAVLKKAFEGELTREWREQQTDLPDAKDLLEQIRVEREESYTKKLDEWKRAVKEWENVGKEGKKPTKPKKPKEIRSLSDDELIKLQILPEEWKWAKIGNLTLGVEYGTSAKSEKSGEVPVLRMGNIQNGRFDWDDLVYTRDKAEIEKYLLKKDDVLFNRTNSPELVGKTAIYKGEKPAIFAGYLIRVNQLPTFVIAEFLNYFLNSHTAKMHGNSVKTDGVNQSNINGEKLSNYPFPFCSITEQQAIVTEIETRLSVCDKVEQDIEENLEKAEALRQSILKKAFEGKLLNERELEEVRSAPDWEPTEVLLERIKAEKAGSSQKRKT